MRNSVENNVKCFFFFKSVGVLKWFVFVFQMAALEIPGNGDTGHHISPESIQKALDSLDPQRKVRLHVLRPPSQEPFKSSLPHLDTSTLINMPCLLRKHGPSRQTQRMDKENCLNNQGFPCTQSQLMKNASKVSGEEEGDKCNSNICHFFSLQDFISKCLLKNPKDRPSARDLLFHAVLFEVHSLKLLAGHAFVKNSSK